MGELAGSGITGFKQRVLATKAGVKLNERRNKALYGHPQGKVVSVIVPVYNVEKYLTECVESILAQTREALEIILIDDGSTDRSAELADSLAQRDSRVRVIHQENSGPGATRNRGILEALGYYIMLVDSDDVLPPDAVANLFRAAEAGQADIAVGRYQRFRDDELIPVRQWMKNATPRERIGVATVECPEVVATITAPTKLFRREFLIDNEVTYPEGVYTEDQLFAAKAYCAAERISVIPRVVYMYRHRLDGTSITDQKAQERFHSDICVQTRATIDYYGAQKPALVSPYRNYLLGVLYPSTIRGMHADEATQQQTMQDACIYVTGLGSDVDLEQTSSVGRIFIYLAMHGRWDLVARFEQYLDEYTGIPPMRIAGGQLLLDFRDYTDLAGFVPDTCARRSEFETRVTAAITDVSIDGPLVEVEFFGAIRGLSMPEPAGELEVWLTNPQEEALVPSSKLVRVEHSEIPNQIRSHVNASYSGSLVQAEFPAGDLGKKWGTELGDLRLKIKLTQEGITRTTVIRPTKALVESLRLPS